MNGSRENSSPGAAPSLLADSSLPSASNNRSSVAAYQWPIDTLQWVIGVVLRPEATQGFVLLKKRWKVERTFGWFNRYRRLSKDDEVLPETREAFIYLAMIRIMVGAQPDLIPRMNSRISAHTRRGLFTACSRSSP